MSLRVGVIGHPVAHSISPVFQQAAFDALGFDARYEPWDVMPDDLETLILSLRDEDALGANVTIPYKEASLRHTDRLHQTARFVGAINTIVRDGAILEAYNTDVTGFQRLLEGAGYDPAGKDALLWGAGGAARAVAWALVWRGVRSITIVNRTAVRAGRLRHDLASTSADVQLRAYGADEEQARSALATTGLVVNCTPIGLRGGGHEHDLPFSPDALGPEVFVADLIANPRESALVRAARERGLQAIGGLPMLVHQGAAAFELWTQQEAPIDVMMRAAEQAMAEAS